LIRVSSSLAIVIDHTRLHIGRAYNIVLLAFSIDIVLFDKYTKLRNGPSINGGAFLVCINISDKSRVSFVFEQNILSLSSFNVLINVSNCSNIPYMENRGIDLLHLFQMRYQEELVIISYWPTLSTMPIDNQSLTSLALEEHGSMSRCSLQCTHLVYYALFLSWMDKDFNSIPRNRNGGQGRKTKIVGSRNVMITQKKKVE